MKPAKYTIPWLILSGLLVLFFVLSLLSTGTYGGADNLAHYRIARYAWLYPHLFLDHWGKPLFTILSAPFAVFGFQGIKTFNLLVGLLTAFFTYKTAGKLSVKNAWMVIFFVVFAPIYSVMMLTTMTEILFSFVLIFAVYLFFSGKYISSAIIISFLPLARTEGIVILIVFLFTFIYNKKWKSLPFLLTGFLLFSLIGYFFYYHDFLWLIHEMPYSSDSGKIYGHGELLHFVNTAPKTIGFALGILSLFGIGIFLKDFFTRKELLKADQKMNVLLIIFGSFLAYFSAHSYVWWKGLGGSLGLIRVMVGIIPLWVIFSLFGYNLVEKWIGKRFKIIFRYLLLLLIIVLPFSVYHIPVKLDYKHRIVKQAADWFSDSKWFHNKIYFYDHYLWYFWDLNPFDTARIQERVPDPQHPAKGVKPNSIVIWDAHFAPNEGRLPLDSMLSNPGYELIHVVYPNKPFKVLGGYDYGIFFFRRIPDSVSVDNYKIIDNFKSQPFHFNHADTLVRRNFLDSLTGASNQEDTAVAFNGLIPSPDQEYLFTSKFSTKKYHGEMFAVEVNLNLDAGNPRPGKLFLVISSGKNGNIADYKAYDLLLGKDNKQTINREIIKKFTDYHSNSVVKIYIWQKAPVDVRIKSYSVIIHY